MSKKNLLILLVVVLVVILIGIGLFLLNSKQNPLSEGEGAEVLEKIEIGEEGWAGKLKDALALGQSLRCEWELEGMSNLYYVKGDKFYSETTTPEGVTYMINDGDCSFIWRGGETQGSKFCQADLPEVKTESGEEEDSGMADFDYSNEQLDYEVDCQTVVVNDLIFNPPVNVEFLNPLKALNLGGDLGL